MKKLVIIAMLLFALPLYAQIPVAVQNPSFESTNAILYASTLGRWNLGPVPGWTTSAGGSAGSFQPTGYASLPDGKTVAYVDGGSLSQDLGVTAQANTNYSLSVYVGHRADGYIANYTISLSSGTVVLCSSSASNGSIPAGTFQQVTLACPITTPLAGNLVITLGSSGPQPDFDNVTLTSQPATPQPFVFTLNGFGSFTFPMYAPPDCSDGSCSIVACNTTTNVCVTLTPGQGGSIVIRKPSGDTAVVNVGP